CVTSRSNRAVRHLGGRFMPASPLATLVSVYVLQLQQVRRSSSMAAGKHSGMPGRRPGGRRHEPGGRCTTCRKRKEKVHRSRKTGRLVCATCADRARMRVGPCTDCGERKL